MLSSKRARAIGHLPNDSKLPGSATISAFLLDGNVSMSLQSLAANEGLVSPTKDSLATSTARGENSSAKRLMSAILRR